MAGRMRIVILLLGMLVAINSELIREARRILVIGSTGSGKSTLINNLVGANVVKTSSGVKGCTAEYEVVNTTHNGIEYSLIDTVGLNEPEEGGRVSSREAFMMLVKFLKENEKGFNMIIFAMKNVRITKEALKTYEVMVKDLYSASESGAPPIMIAVGGMFWEHADPQEWCEEQRDDYLLQGFEEARRDLNALHCLSIPDKAVNGNFEASFKSMRAGARDRAWNAIEALVLEHPRPFASDWRGIFSIAQHIYNFFASWFGWSKYVHVPEVFKNLSGTFGVPMEELEETLDNMAFN